MWNYTPLKPSPLLHVSNPWLGNLFVYKYSVLIDFNNIVTHQMAPR